MIINDLLKEGVEKNYVIKTDQRKKLTIEGQPIVYDVYKIDLNALYYNDKNDRIATWISKYKAEHNNEEFNTNDRENYNNIIQEFIVDSNQGAIDRTQSNIDLIGQQEPGVVLNDGRIIDGNRRYTCLRRLKEHNAMANGYFEAIILNYDLKHNEKQIKMDNAFLKENCFILDYENERLVGINKLEQNIEFNVFNKIHLRRFVESCVGNKVAFKENLSYVDFEKIINLFKNKLPNVSLFTTATLDEYITSKQMYLNDRKDLGIQIKLKDDLCKNELEKYKLVLAKTMTRQLREQQLWDSFYMCKMKKCSNFSVPGSGKTSSVLGVFAYLQDCGNVDRIVVICPKNAFESWKNEFNICFRGKQELKCFDIQSNDSSQQKHYLLENQFQI